MLRAPETHITPHVSDEDPRMTFVDQLQRCVMTYTCQSSEGPHNALAVSQVYSHWKRLALASVQTYCSVTAYQVGLLRLIGPEHLPSASGVVGCGNGVNAGGRR